MDVHTPEQRSRNMRAIRSKDTKPERMLCKALWAMGYRYRKNDKRVFGRPDLTFYSRKISIFVDSEFFHGKDWEISRYNIKSNRDFWWGKIESNIARDQKVTLLLEKDGWKVIRYWDKELVKNLANCISKIESAYHGKK
jgi:DNA mismatch endonuclease, patch repair protein